MGYGHHTEEISYCTPSPPAQKIIDILSRPFDLEGREVFVSPSIRIAVYPSCRDEDNRAPTPPCTVLKKAGRTPTSSIRI